ncbi:NADH:flavin oxidoreductase/NADH oxidase, partial [Rhizobiaceae sp. 2RAB30]
MSHAGRKAGAAALCDGGSALPPDQLHRDGRSFVRIGPSPVAAGDEWTVPREMTLDDIAAVRQSFRDAIMRADKAGVDVTELHFAHGYLVASFLSPHSNIREDAYGGDRERRMRLAVEIAMDAREIWPAHKPLFARLSVFDGAENGWNLDDSIVLARKLKDIGIDVIDCSSGGLTDATTTAAIPRGLGFQVSFSARIKRETGVLTQAVGMIVDAGQAEEILAAGNADLIAIGREALFDPFWARHAAQQLGADIDFRGWNPHNGAYLA